MTNTFLFARPARSAGVTLIELAVTIALVGILAALMVNFVAPVRSYIDSSRRAALADTADTALRRMGRDVRLALPNSTRVTESPPASGIFYLEFMLVRTGGRYRFESTGSPATNNCPDGLIGDIDPTLNVLSFSAADTCFTTIGNLPNIAQVTANDYVVVYNLPTGTANADAYEFTGTGGNKAKIAAPLPLAASTGEDRIKFASNTFTFESPARRFFIIEGPVSYICVPSATPGVGTLTRRWGYTISAAQPTSFSDGSSALMASGVTACSITYGTSVISQGAGLVTMALRLGMQDSRGDTESVNLYHAVHVNNLP